jgi:hypothetical protein
MTEPPDDLGKLLNFIIDNKDIEATVNICPKCKINAEDLKPLVKIINYLINYLTRLTDDMIDITLKKQSAGCLLCFIVSTNHKELPPLSDNINDALQPYNGAMKIVFEEGKYVQILICFYEEQVPTTVIIEV